MTQILAFSGKKQSGKNTSFHFLLGLELLRLAVVQEKIEINEDGQLWVSDIFGNSEFSGILNVDSPSNDVIEFNKEFIWPFIKNFSFADCLKKEFCIDLLGVPRESMYGTDEQKKQPTHLLWENMPNVVTEKSFFETLELKEVRGRLGKYYDKVVNGKLVYHEPGPMSGREVMQFIGTEVMRHMYDDIWVNATVDRIKNCDTKFAIITDLRFPKELEAVKKMGGKVIRFLRAPFNDDHISETALDHYPESAFDAVVDNREMTISEQNGCVYNVLTQWEWVDPIN